MRAPTSWFLCLILAVSCGQPVYNSHKGLDRFSWILGSWEFRTADSVWHYETWEKQNDTLFGGFGFTRRSDSLLSSEILALELVNDTVYYTARAKGQNNEKAIRFRVMYSDTLGFTSENPAHDYPQKITYRHGGIYPDDSLVAVISGPGPNNKPHDITFAFKRKSP